MDELIKTFEGRQEEEEPADVTGLLAVHIAAMHTIRDDTRNSVPMPAQSYSPHVVQLKALLRTCWS
jgi:hypothetical protein